MAKDKRIKEFEKRQAENRLYLQLDIPGFGYINYISQEWEMFYAPDQVRSMEAAWSLSTSSQKARIKKMLASAVKCVESWEIRDDVDAKDKEYVLATAAKLLK